MSEGRLGGFEFEFHSNNYNTCGKIIWQNSQKFAGVQKLVQPPFWPAATCKEVLGVFCHLKDFLHPTCISPVTPSHAKTRLLCLVFLQSPIQPEKIIYNLDAKCFPGSSLSYIQASILENLGAFHEIYIHTSRLLKLQPAGFSLSLDIFGHIQI